LRHYFDRRGCYFHEAKPEMSFLTSRVVLCAALLLGFSGVWELQQAIDARFAALHQEQDDLVLRSGPLLKAMSLEYAPLIADLYWTRAVQYYGDKQAREDTKIELLWPLLDVTTTLDPNLLIAYRFGSVFLSEPPPRGAGRPERGIELLQRGIRANPDYWRFYEDLGFIYYFDLKDYRKAADAFLEGSTKPGAMIWMKTFAARINEEGESRQTAAMLWTEIYNSAADPTTKENAKIHLQLLRAEIDCEQLNKIAEEYEKRTGRLPSNMRELVAAGLLRGLAADPVGFVYVFEHGKAQLNPASPLYKKQPQYKRTP
jgi:tetratricopeptide (TPR) repeat protein